MTNMNWAKSGMDITTKMNKMRAVLKDIQTKIIGNDHLMNDKPSLDKFNTE